MKTKNEILEETIEFYNNNPRSTALLFNTMSCQYLTNNGDKCAFARCCTEDGVKILHSAWEGESVLGLIAIGGHDKLLKEEYQGHNDTFWSRIQVLHDTETFWDVENKTLSVEGLKWVAELKEQFKQLKWKR